MPSVQDYVKSKHLTAKQGEKLPHSYALKVGAKNRKNKHTPKPSLSKEEWAQKKKNKNKNKKKK